jgi:hypothetical protein
MTETMCEYWKRRQAIEIKKYETEHWMPEIKPKYVIGVPQPVLDYNKDSILNDPEGCW